MDVHQLIATLEGTFDPRPEVRVAAEQTINAVITRK
jgi:hypothetical protein